MREHEEKVYFCPWHTLGVWKAEEEQLQQLLFTEHLLRAESVLESPQLHGSPF